MAKRHAAAGNTPGPVKGRRPQRRFDRTEIIIDTAAEIFRRNGYDATGLQEIADAVGILKGSMYHYIDTKEDLLFAIIKRNHDRIIGGNQEWREIEDPVQALRSFVEGHIRRSLESPTDSVVFVQDFRALGPARAAEIREAEADYDRDFRALVERALDAGVLREGVEPAFASRAVFGMVNWIHYWYSPDGDLAVDEIAEELATYALASLMGDVPA